MTEDKVVEFTGVTVADIPVQKLVNNIPWGDLEDVLIIAEDKSGTLRVFSNKSPIAPMIYMMEQVKFDLLAGVYSK